MTIPLAQPEAVVQKLFRLRFKSATQLKIAAAERTATSGRRVTETEIVEELIVKHLKTSVRI